MVMEPVIMALKEEYEGQVEFIIVDVRQPDGSRMAQEYGIRSIPHIIMLDRLGDVVFNEVGEKSKDYFKDRLDKLLQPAEAAAFHTTSNPQDALVRSLEEGKPVLLDFYSDT